MLIQWRQTLRKEPASDSALALLQQQLDALRSQVSEVLNQNTGLVIRQLGTVMQQVNQQLGSLAQQFQGTTANISSRLDQAAQVIGGVRDGLGELRGSTQRIIDIGQDIARLQEILSPPKTRGVLGELFLSEVIAAILPQEHYRLQYKFSTGEKVDAIIRLNQGIVPVDAKFPLENFRRLLAAQSENDRKRLRREFFQDVKRHIDDIAHKYIRPDEGTLDFALMYVPAENVYYEMITQDAAGEEGSISAYARLKRVVPVSPNSFYAYLLVIDKGLRGLQIERQAKKIMDLLGALNNELVKFRKDFETLGQHIINARNKYEESEKKLSRFEDRLSGAATAQGEIPFETQSIQP